MAVILTEHIPGGHLAILENPGPEGGAAAGVDPADLASASRFSNPRRSADHLWARAALRTLLPNARITYDPHGAPLIGNAPGYHYVGFSHCRGAAAAIVSAYPCAVDIEHLGRDFTRASAKFVSGAERMLLGAGHPLFVPALWCAKEAIYKLARIPGLDFTKDLEVTSADLTALDHGGRGRLAARIGETGRVEVTVRVAGEFIFCYLAQQG